MNPRAQALFWIGAALCLLLALALLGQILLPFVLGIGIGYVLDPPVTRLQRVGFSRLWATTLVVLFTTLLILVALIALLPPLIEQLGELMRSLPGYIGALRRTVTNLSANWGTQFAAGSEAFETAIGQIGQQAAEWAAGLVGSLWVGGMALINFLALLLVTPIVTFYFLKDWERMIATADAWLPRPYAPTIRQLAREIDDVISGFIRGQVTVLVILSIIYMIGLMAIGLKLGLLIGLIAGLISFIPYVGPTVGFVLGGLMAVVQFGGDWVSIGMVTGVFVLGQVIESNVLSPLIVGDRVRLHPLWLILAIFVFGYLFGFVGLLLAVPIAAAIGVLVRFALRQYLESPLYTGETARAPRAATRRHVSRRPRA